MALKSGKNGFNIISTKLHNFTNLVRVISTSVHNVENSGKLTSVYVCLIRFFLDILLFHRMISLQMSFDSIHSNGA